MTLNPRVILYGPWVKSLFFEYRGNLKMTISVIATLIVQEGKQAEMEAAFKALAEQVRANEPGNLAYHLTRSRDRPDLYKVLEIYAGQQALEAHRASAHFREIAPVLKNCLACRAEAEYLDGV
jgi:quinol monooxygenase YgiN